MKTLKDIQLEVNELSTLRKVTITEHERFIKETDNKIARLKRLEALSLANIDIAKIQIAERIISCTGNPSNNVDGRVITEAAALDIAKGHPHLKTMFFGNKTYEAFYQSSDHPYGYGPKHGGIRDRVEMSEVYRDKELTEEEAEACIYYLKNFANIRKALVL